MKMMMGASQCLAKISRLSALAARPWICPKPYPKLRCFYSSSSKSATSYPNGDSFNNDGVSTPDHHTSDPNPSTASITFSPPTSIASTPSQSASSDLHSPSATAPSAPLNPSKKKKKHQPPPLFHQIVLNELDLEESFVKGSGPGGQKINKKSSRVQLKHIPTGIIVETQRFRDLFSNRKEARKLLRLKLDEILHGEKSKKAMKIAKEIKRKKKKAQKLRKKQKAAGSAAESDGQAFVEEEDDEEEDDEEGEEDVEEGDGRESVKKPDVEVNSVQKGVGEDNNTSTYLGIQRKP
ncbi:hypothetical protein HDV05_007265 [Chytridiales sp. JEL 0842]|nr:hypothetical protein HDV05_007265 [Chytridiales sp. JEL 0842]